MQSRRHPSAGVKSAPFFCPAISSPDHDKCKGQRSLQTKFRIQSLNWTSCCPGNIHFAKHMFCMSFRRSAFGYTGTDQIAKLKNKTKHQTTPSLHPDLHVNRLAGSFALGKRPGSAPSNRVPNSSVPKAGARYGTPSAANRPLGAVMLQPK